MLRVHRESRGMAGAKHAQVLSGRLPRTLALAWAGKVDDMTWASMLLL
jgi:hypothetical protein